MPACAQAAAKSGYRGSFFGTTVRSTEDAADKLTGLRVFDQSFVHKSTNGLCRYDGDIGYVNSTHAAQGIPDAELMAVDQFGHLIWWGDPSVRANLHLRIEAFLSEHAGRLTRSGQQPSG